MWQKFIQFCHKHDLQYVNPSTETLCLYVQYLMENFKAAKSVKSYVGTIDLLHKYIDVTPHNLQSFEVTLMLRVATLTMRSIPRRAEAIPVTLLRRICQACDRQGDTGIVLKIAILMGYSCAPQKG